MREGKNKGSKGGWKEERRQGGKTFLLLFLGVLLDYYGGGGLVANSCPTLAIPWTLAHQAPRSMGFSRQEYWSGLPFPSPGDLPDPGVEALSPELQADCLPSEPPGKPMVSGILLDQGLNPGPSLWQVNS